MDKAVLKIKGEMESNNNIPYVQVVGNFLLGYLAEHQEAVDKIAVEDKTILKSLDFMKKEAEKKKVGNCAVLTDEEVFSIVLKYFDIDNEAKMKNKFDLKLEDLI